MREITIRPVLPGDAEAVVANLRPHDRDECDALLGPGKVLHAVHEGLSKSLLAWTGTVGEEVALVGGLVPLNLLAGQGAPWMVGTPLIDRHPGAFIRLNAPYIARMLAVLPHLINVVDARNVKSIRWLRRAGFTVHPPIPLGVAGLPFHPFTLDA